MYYVYACLCPSSLETSRPDPRPLHIPGAMFPCLASWDAHWTIQQQVSRYVVNQRRFLSSSSLRACAVVRDGLQRVHSCWYRLRVYMYYRVPTLLLLVKQRKRRLLTSNARIPRSLRTCLALVGNLSPDRINLMGACVWKLVGECNNRFRKWI